MKIKLTKKTAIEEEGIFYLRPLFYPDDQRNMKYGLESSNFKVGYESYFNELHPEQDETGSSIFDVAMIVDRKTKKILKENKKLTPGINYDS